MSTTALSHAPIRALFLDIDGTLVGMGDRISPGVLRALSAAHTHGCEIVICTGRARYTAQPIAAQLPRPLGYAVTSNGGVVMHLGTGEVLLRRLLSVPTALDVVRTMVELGATPYVYEDAVGHGIEAARVLHPPDFPTGPFAIAPRYRPHDKILDHLPFAPVSVNAFGPPDQMRALADAVRARIHADLSVVISGSELHWGVEVFAAGVSKRLGLETLAARLDVTREEIMAIGDHFNDLEMIRWAGLGVAMGNALPEIQHAADYVTGSLDEDGVAQAIERFVLASG